MGRLRRRLPALRVGRSMLVPIAGIGFPPRFETTVRVLPVIAHFWNDNRKALLDMIRHAEDQLLGSGAELIPAGPPRPAR